MQEWKNLLNVAEALLGENGCPWDKEQTLHTLQPYLLEEAHELIEAIDLDDSSKIKEELGDLFYALIFIAMLGEKENRFSLEDSLTSVKEKLIRRHPHVFGDKKLNTVIEIEKNWEEVKRKEGKKHPLEGIAPTMPAMARAQKVILKLRRAGEIEAKETTLENEEMVAEKLWEAVREADALGIDAESALRRYCQQQEKKHRR